MPYNLPDFKSLEEISKEIADSVEVEEDSPILNNSERSASALEFIQKSIEQDRQERIQAEKSAKRWQIAGLVVGILTLIATVVFGLLTVLG